MIMDVDFVFTARRHLHRLRDDLAAVKAELKFRRFWREWKYGFRSRPAARANWEVRVLVNGRMAEVAVFGIAASDRPRIARRTFGAVIAQVAMWVIDAFRSENGLRNLFGDRLGTVSVTTFNGENIFGSNSTSPPTRPKIAGLRFHCEAD